MCVTYSFIENAETWLIYYPTLVLILSPVDTGFSLQNDSVTALVNAIVYAPIPTYDQLMALSDEDEGVVWDAITDVLVQTSRETKPS